MQTHREWTEHSTTLQDLFLRCEALLKPLMRVTAYETWPIPFEAEEGEQRRHQDEDIQATALKSGVLRWRDGFPESKAFFAGWKSTMDSEIARADSESS